MASKLTVNDRNVRALGPKRLAALLLELSNENPAIKRRLRLELAGKQSPQDVVKVVTKRLASHAQARGYVHWDEVKALAEDLEAQRQAIATAIGPTDPAGAVTLLWQFLGLAPFVFARCDDSSGRVGDVFRTVREDLGRFAEVAHVDPIALADRVFAALLKNDYGQYDDLIAILKPSLRPEGLAHLKRRFLDLSRSLVSGPADNARPIVGYVSAGPIYADEVAARARHAAIRSALQDIADAQGDVDAFIEQFDEATRKVPRIAAAIAARLCDAERPTEALQSLDAAASRSDGWPEFEWENARIRALEALGRREDAQAVRWSCFLRSLSTGHLRAYLDHVPDFEDVEAEARALTHAEEFPSLLHSLAFLISWPALDRASALIIRRAKELDGDHYELLTPAAEALAGTYPLAAMVVLRSMVDFALSRGRSMRYRHAARNLMECARLASSIADYGEVTSHEDYVARLRAKHARKSAFWAAVAEISREKPDAVRLGSR